MQKIALACALVGLMAIPAMATEAEAPTIAPPACDYGSPHPDAPAEMAQFDFLIGDYAIEAAAWRNEAWTPPRPGPRARWNGRYILGGMAIQDEWFDPDPGLDPSSPRGVNVRMWDADAGEWDMMWIHTSGKQVLDLRAAMVDDVLTMWQIYPEGVDSRSTFHRLSPDSWERISYVRDEEGEWAKQFRLRATRIPCPAEKHSD